MKLLIVRPQPGADATAARVRAAGFEALVMPLFVIEPADWKAPDVSAYDALLFTSGNTVRMAGQQLQDLQDLPVYAVGSATAAALEEHGLKADAVGASGVDEILSIAQANGHRKILWLAGEHRTDANPAAEIALDVRTVYRSAASDPPSEFVEQVEKATAVLIHSARAVRHFSDLCGMHAIDRSSVTLAVLSPKIGKSAATGWHSVVVAPDPNDASLLSALQRHFTMRSRDP